MTIKNKIWTGIIVCLLILIVVGYSSYRSTQHLISTANAVKNVHQVDKMLELILSKLKDAETGQRGYLLTGDITYLEPYQSGKENISELISKSSHLVIENAYQINRIERLTVLSKKKLAELKETVFLYQTAKPIAALDLVLTNQGKDMMGEIRTIISEIRAEEQRNLILKERLSESAVQLATYISTFGYALVLLIIVTIITVIGRAGKRHIDERTKANKQLSYQASHDSLTGLINRREFERRTEGLLATSKEQSQHHALCYMDLDQFKVVNDTCGHTAGDEMLRQISAVLQRVVRHNDSLARLGGDEFGILMEQCSLDEAHRITGAIQTAVNDYQFIFEGHSFRVGVSIGLVPMTETTLNITEMQKNADAACYMAKEKGRNRTHVHRDNDKELAKRHGEMLWVSRIQEALNDNRFCLYAQAIESLDRSSDVHYELLIRMLDEQGQIIPPGTFLPTAERYNLITKLDRWVVENTFRLLTESPAFFEQVNFISINLSGQSLTDETFLDFVIKQLQVLDTNRDKICFEITETAAISNLLMAERFIAELGEFGCRFALDDFGSGLSSFAYLKNLPVDYLKIDGMFVKDMVVDPIDHAMVKSINEIGQVMGMKTIAEFVENDEIKGMLREIGVNYAQGYGIHKPQPFVELLSR